MKPLKKINNIVTPLPRGGYLVDTSSGYIQFGSPAETIKDTMLLPKGVPLIFVLPSELFNWLKGISIAEVEFPIYYNFFIRNMKTRIICYKEQAERFKKILQESVFGPKKPNFQKDYSKDIPVDIIPKIKNEMDYFRTMKFDDIVEFCTYNDNSCGVGDISIKIDDNKNFEVFDKDELIAYIPGRIEYKPKYLIGKRLKEPFIPPLFAMTCLGPSSGFDPFENTSGFIAWVNHNGIMIDPPVNSTEWLLDSNVNPKFIDSIILTHCHADHDAGTFQKILEEGKIKVYTTETIMMSFLRKYSALIDVSTDYLMKLFNFYPIKIGKPVFIHGARFDIFYSLHSIPTMGFRIEFQNKSLTYSSDHNNDPALHKKLFDEKIISEDRYKELSNFPWGSNIVYHESGVPPLHTPIDYLDSLPKNKKKKTVVYHIPQKDMPKKSLLTIAKFGIENTQYFKTKAPSFERAYQVIGLFKYADILSDMETPKVQEFVSIIEEESFKRGERIIKSGTPGDKFYIIYSGNVSIKSEDGNISKIFGTYDYFGEHSIMTGETRSADVIAETDVVLFSIGKDKFLSMIVGTKYEKQLKHLVEIRNNETWDILSKSGFFIFLTSSQRTFLELIITPDKKTEPGTIFNKGDKLDMMYIIREGNVVVSNGDDKISILQRGDLFGSVVDIFEDRPSSYAFSNDGPLSLYSIKASDFKKFLQKYPGLIMKFDYIFKQYFF
ncbi:cAMP/cGMP-dependent 3',5'-cyclic-AMP/GMP phosphodiesterase [Spirochaetota bacterium]